MTMKKTVWTFGLIAGGVLSVMMLATLPFQDVLGVDKGAIIGYATMVLAFLMVFFGVRSYRDNVGNGTISFGRALALGALIALVASMCYVATWELVFYKLAPDFSAKFEAASIAHIKASGASQASIDAQVAKAKHFTDTYKNPLVNIAITFLEPLPVSVVFVLISAGILRRKRREDPPALAATAIG